MAQIKNLSAAAAILGEQLDGLLTKRADALARMTDAEKELADLNPQIAKLEAVFASPPNPAAPAPVALAS